MKSTLQKFFYYFGIASALYVLFYYVVPFAIKAITVLFKILFYVAIIGIVGFVVYVAITAILKYTGRGGGES